jgi:hypothetical protein
MWLTSRLQQRQKDATSTFVATGAELLNLLVRILTRSSDDVPYRQGGDDLLPFAAVAIAAERSRQRLAPSAAGVIEVGFAAGSRARITGAVEASLRGF